MPQSQISNVANMSFKAICITKILMKISGFIKVNQDVNLFELLNFHYMIQDAEHTIRILKTT